ncbi:glycosyltransferase family 2 protein [Blastococcus mobilis]|uniref:glycosyltransferase family 2 protein n=1 Tax=Blastococcus mobilis TaxID=1938746 RepID=UPI001595390C|nr:glycosyltransferase family 2 protein [Blastococcus mobilis]
MAKVSVIIPAYNAEEFLERAVRSALAQTHRDLEVIVVDDGSADATSGVALRIAEEDRRVRALRNGENSGVSASRNRAIALASGEWIALLDADDTWLPQRLEALLAAANGADVVCDDLLFINESRTGTTAVDYWSLCGWVGLRRRRPYWLTLAEFIRYDLGLLKPIMRRDFLTAHEMWYDTNLRVTEDYYLYFRILAAGARWRQLPDGYYLYLRHANSLTLSPDAVVRQHLVSSMAILSDPAVNADRNVTSALRRHHRQSRASIAKQQIFELVRRRDFLALGQVLRENPDYAFLVLWKIAWHMYMRMVRRVQNPRRPVPARMPERSLGVTTAGSPTPAQRSVTGEEPAAKRDPRVR